MRYLIKKINWHLIAFLFVFSCSFIFGIPYSYLLPSLSTNHNLDNSYLCKGSINSAGNKYVKGVSLSPIDYAGNFSAFFDKAREAGTILTWGGDWDILNNKTGQAYGITDLFLSRGFTPVIIVHPETPHEVNESQKQWAKYYADKYKPKYLGIGNEINGDKVYNKTDGPQVFFNFTRLFNETYDIIKSVSPDTKIFTIFQLEYMKGLQGGLFNNGGNDTVKNNDWFLMKNASKADFFAFTTYPCFIFKDPTEMPSDYYSEITTYTNKSIAFTEIGWFYEGPSGWESTKQEEAAFINRYFELTRGLSTFFNIWAFLYDQTATFPFNKMGLLSTDETTSAPWVTWLNAGKDIITDDDDDDDDDEEAIIPGYNLLVLVGIFAIVSVILIKKSKIFQKFKI